uniref:Suppressor APC domain containing 1 n=1 Tax=Anabas testudineus TaxID=64144 RepID=A0A3Q1I229_ANATE
MAWGLCCTVPIMLLYMRLQTSGGQAYYFSHFRLLFQIKRLKDLEKEKDALWSGLEILEKARMWYVQQLQENRAQQNNMKIKSGFGSCQESVVEVGAFQKLKTLIHKKIPPIF